MMFITRSNVSPFAGIEEMPKLQPKADYSRLQMEQLLSTNFLSKNIDIEITDVLILKRHNTQKLSFIHSETPEEHFWTVCYQSDNHLYFFDSEGLFTDHFNSSQFVRDNYDFLRVNSFHFHICESWFAYDKYKLLDEDGFTEYGMTGPLSMALARCILNKQDKTQMVVDIQPKESFTAHRDWSKIPNPPKQHHTIHHVNLLPSFLTAELKTLLVPYAVKVVQDEKRKTALKSISERLIKLIPPTNPPEIIKSDAQRISPTTLQRQSTSHLPITESPAAAATSFAEQHLGVITKTTHSSITKLNEKINELNRMLKNTLEEKEALLKSQRMMQSHLDDSKKAVIQLESQLVEARSTIELMINKISSTPNSAQEIEKASIQVRDLKQQLAEQQSSHLIAKQEDSAIINELKKELEALKQNHQKSAGSSSSSVTTASQSNSSMSSLGFDSALSTVHNSPLSLRDTPAKSRTVCIKDLKLLKTSISHSDTDEGSMPGTNNLQEKQDISEAFFSLSFRSIHSLVLAHKVDADVTKILNFPGYGPARINTLLHQLNHDDIEVELSMLRKIPGYKLRCIMGDAYEMSLAELISSKKNKLIVSENHVDPFAKRTEKKPIGEKPRYLFQDSMFAPKRARLSSTEQVPSSTNPSNHSTTDNGVNIISSFINSDQQFNELLALVERDTQAEISDKLHL